MKKIVYVLCLLFCIIGCRKQHVYHTYYGDIDIDSLEAYYAADGSAYYALSINEFDSAQAAVMGQTKLYMITYYTPSKNVYFSKIIGGDGSSGARVYFNPYTGETDSIR